MQRAENLAGCESVGLHAFFSISKFNWAIMYLHPVNNDINFKQIDV